MSEPTQPRFDDRSPGEEPLSTADLAGTRTAGAEPDPNGGPGPDPAPQAEAPVREPRSFEGREAEDPSAPPVFPPREADDLRQQWNAIQASFVDEPRRAVEDADHLVAATMKRLAESFAQERAGLEGQWGRGDDVSTEDLRVALRRYRSFFGRLLSA